MTVRQGNVEIRQYWDLHFDPIPRSTASAEKELLALLDDALQRYT